MSDAVPQVFIDSVRTDPLFAAEGMDLTRAQAALGAIEREAATLQQLISATGFSRRLFLLRYPISSSAFPVPFLKAFVESETMRREFLSQPDSSRAKNLLRGWRTTARAYAKAVTRYDMLHRVLARMSDDSASTEYHDVVGHAFTVGSALRAVACMSANARALGGEVAARESLLRGEAKTLREPPPSRPLSCEAAELSELHANLHALTLQNSMPFRSCTIEETYGPLRLALSAFDERETPHVFYWCRLADPKTKLEFMWVSLADRFYFQPLGTGREHPETAIYQTLIRKGLRYWYQPGANIYTSRDAQYWLDVATAADRARRPALDAGLVLKQRSSMLDLLLGTCALDLVMYIGNMKERIESGDLSYRQLLFATLIRTHPSLYFMPFNGSVWRIPERPNFLGVWAKPRKTPYVFEAELAGKLSPAELELIMSGGRIREAERARANAPRR